MFLLWSVLVPISLTVFVRHFANCAPPIPPNSIDFRQWVIRKPVRPCFQNTFPQHYLHLDENVYPDPLEINSAIYDRYQTIKELGRGTYGIVIEAYDHCDRRRVAIKIMFLLPVDNPQYYSEDMDFIEGEDRNYHRLDGVFEEELTMMARVTGCPSVISLEGYFLESGAGFLVMPLMKMSLTEFMQSSSDYQRASVPLVRQLARQLTAGLACLHSRDVRHGDLKPANILIEQTNPIKVRICDFGLSVFASVDSRSMRMTAYYEAPEVTAFKTGTKKVDIWSLGMVLGEVFLQRFIVCEMNDSCRLCQIVCLLFGREYVRNVQRVPIAIPNYWMSPDTFLPQIPGESHDYGLLRDFILSLLSIEQERPTAAEAMRHAFIAT